MKKKFIFVIALWFSLPPGSYAQDVQNNEPSKQYSSVGFQASFVSGIGISYGFNESGKYRVRGTFGILTSSGKTYSSMGADYQIELTKREDFRVFIGPGIGVRSISGEDSHTMVGLGTGVEAPITGRTVFENITAGVAVYYPTYFFLSKDISFAGSVFISYNF